MSLTRIILCLLSAATASAPALLGLFEHALDEARARNAPPPRLAALLRGSPGLVFLKGDL